MKFLKKKLRNSLIFRKIALLRNVYYDWKILTKFGSLLKSRDDSWAFDTKILMFSHGLQKGLSLRNPKKIFGLDAANKLEKLLSKRESLFGSSWVTEMAKNVLSDLYLHNSGSNNSKIERKNSINFISEDIDMSYEQFSKFVKSRHSTRQFSSKDVDINIVKDAIELAQRAPSVCNRQCIRSIVIKKKEVINKLLELQNGNKGFRDEINTLIIITSDARGFYEITERNQPWIDGGLFSMLLSLGLLSKGVGSCMLNWCVNPPTDIKIREILPIKNSEIIIMYMAVGHLQNSYVVANSPRRPISEVLTII